jgi:molybdopterin synthase sulfur carrier subunit
MASIRIPTPLRTYTQGRDTIDVAGRTVRETIQKLATGHQGIGGRILDADGALRRFVNVYVNDRDIRALKGLDTEVHEEDVLSIVPAIAGGRP